MKRTSLLAAVLAAGLSTFTLLADPYYFLEGYTVLDEANLPGIGANLGATAGQERDIAIDAARGILYIARGGTTTADGRVTGTNGVAAIIVTNGIGGGNYTDTGLLIPDSEFHRLSLGFHQSLAYDAVSDKLYVFGGGAVATASIFTAPGGTLGGQPNGGDPSAPNQVLRRAFQLTNLPESQGASANRGGTPRGVAVRTDSGVTTVYVAMGHHAQAWRNDVTDTNAAGYPWRRLWATLRVPTQNNVNNRYSSSGLNGIAVDDQGNCFFTLQGTSPARVWMVPADVTSLPLEMDYLDFDDRALGGANASPNAVILPVIAAVPSTITFTSPQGITIFRSDDGRKGCFVSSLGSATARGVVRMLVEDTISITANNYPYVSASVIDSFGSGQPAENQDPILASMRLKLTSGTQPAGTSNGLLYHDVDNPLNPTYLYFVGFVTDTMKGQTIPTATIGKVVIPVLPPVIVVPEVTSQPQPVTILEGGEVELSVVAVGQSPLLYQWQFNENDIPGATSPTFTFTAQLTNAGNYRVVVRNAFGEATSSNAVLTVRPTVQSSAVSLLWRIGPGDRPYLTVNNTQRGLAYNPATGNLLLVSRASGVAVHVLNGQTGEDLHTLSLTGVSGGDNGITLNLIGVADDGAVYAANLTLNGSATALKIYRWASDAPDTDPTVAYNGDPGDGHADRWGDTLDVRGTGVETQILLGTREGTSAALFTTVDGLTFSPQLIATDVTAGDMGLGIAFGAGDTFWTKAGSRPLRQIQFDPALATGTTIFNGGTNIPNSLFSIGIETTRNFLAGISLESPDNLQLYNLANLPEAPTLLHQELFGSDNPNSNGTGAVDFGGDKLFALDSNNGILALTVGDLPSPDTRLNFGIENNRFVLTWTGSFVLQAANTVDGQFEDVSGAVSGYSAELTETTQRFYRLRSN